MIVDEIKTVAEQFVETAGAKKSASSPQAGGCRFCQSQLRQVFVDLGMSPLCESFLTSEQLKQMEPFYPLRVFVCEACFLVQLEQFVQPAEIFNEYAYFSSFADTWVQHAREYTDMITKRLQLNEQSQVVEIASNDGYLLQHFLAKGIPILGIEPARNVAEAAIRKGIPTRVQFFNESSAMDMIAEEKAADLLIGNNVLAQVPDLNGFVRAMKMVLKPSGVITLEFPHLLRLIEGNQFDTIYHEHFSYFSFYAVEQIFAAHGLKVFDVEELSTHGGSLRIYACHSEDASRSVSQRVKNLRQTEDVAGLTRLEFYFSFSEKVERIKHRLLQFLIDAKDRGKQVVGYGAPGKGNTLLNFCGIRTDFLDYTVDRNPYKHGKFTPGAHIPIFPPDKIKETRPDFVLILPWNFKEEIQKQMAFIRDWGGKFVVPIPEVQVCS